MLHRHGPAQARCAAQDGQPGVVAGQPALMEPVIRERAARLIARRPADRRGIRLGRPRLDRADHPDAGHPVRLPVLGGPPQADPLVGRGHRPADSRAVQWSRDRGGTARRASIECLDYFTDLWNERVNAPPADLISMLAHGGDAEHGAAWSTWGNLILLIVGGNDTTRNTISGGLYALNQFPGEYDKLRANPGLIPNMVSEIIRWQTPLAHMRRTARRRHRDRRQAHQGRATRWSCGTSRATATTASSTTPDVLLIDRERPRQHLSFGFGIHRCVGNRLAELQLKIVWEEILKRFPPHRGGGRTSPRPLQLREGLRDPAGGDPRVGGSPIASSTAFIPVSAQRKTGTQPTRAPTGCATPTSEGRPQPPCTVRLDPGLRQRRNRDDNRGGGRAWCYVVLDADVTGAVAALADQGDVQRRALRDLSACRRVLLVHAEVAPCWHDVQQGVRPDRRPQRQPRRITATPF